MPTNELELIRDKYQQELNAAKEKIAELESLKNETKLQSQELGELKVEVSEHVSTIEQLKNVIQEMSTEIANLEGEKAYLKVTRDRLQNKVDQAIKVLQMDDSDSQPKNDEAPETAEITQSKSSE